MKHLICFLLLSLTLLSCKSDSPTKPSVPGDFVPLPLKVGNTWVYRRTVLGQTSYDTCRIVSTTTINSQLVYVFDDTWFFDKDGFYYNDGTLYGMRVSGADQKLEVVWPKNLVIGQTWHVYDVESTFKLEALDETVSVPAGTFSCSRLTVLHDAGNTDSLWVSSGKGLIKISWTSGTYELISLTLN